MARVCTPRTNSEEKERLVWVKARMFDEVTRDRFATERSKAVLQRLNLKFVTQKMATEAAWYCWFARDDKATMLGVKNKSIFLFWEQNSILM